jgi:stage V sporulation protein AE
MGKKKVILITDGDDIAAKAVQEAAINIGGRCISRTAGNPTEISGERIIELINESNGDPILVMVDDKGHSGLGQGEMAMKYIIESPEVEVLGVVAVASNTKNILGIKVDYSVDRNGELINKAVDKCGRKKKDKIVKGDTVDILNYDRVPIVIGIGDPGKMDGYDSTEIGAPIVTRAIEEIIKVNRENKKPDI